MIRNSFIILTAFVLILVGAHCSIDEPDPDNDQNKHELPVGKGKLKVLAIGNSFVDDPMACFDDIVQASGIDCSKLCIYAASVGNTSLQYWADKCASGEQVTIKRYSGQLDMAVTKAPLKELLAQDWDVVTVQQLSSLAQDSTSLLPPLPYLVSQIRENCPNKGVVIAFQQVWSYWLWDQSSLSNWERITEVVKLTLGYGVDMIIPTGTAIQNARGTELNTQHELTRDSVHLCYGAGQYVAACTWFEALLAPVFGISVLGNTATHEITEEEMAESEFETVAVTDLNRTLCQQCATAAVKHPFLITPVTSL